MTRNPDNEYSQLATVFDLVWEEWRKELNTALPAIVQSYDGETKRAIVIPAITVRMKNGDERRRAPLYDVPVVHPGGGGFVVHMPLKKGDKVLLVYSQRGIAEFKRLWAEAAPDKDSLLSSRDAFAIPMGQGKEITVIDEDAVTLQREDGTGAVRITSDSVIIDVASGQDVHLGGESGEELATKSFVSAVFNSHTHPTSVGPTGPPTVPATLQAPNITTKTKAE